MKTQFAIAALTFGAIVLGTNNIQAQELTATTADTEATIELEDVISIDAIHHKPLNFIYKSAADYNKDQTKDEATTLTVTSSQEFSIKVNAGGTNFTDNSNNIIPVDVLKINAVAVKGKTGTGYVELSHAGGTLVDKSQGGSELQWLLDYTIPAEKSSTVILGKPAGKYTQTVTYTATTK